MKLHMIVGGLLFLIGATACGNNDGNTSSGDYRKDQQAKSLIGHLDSFPRGKVMESLVGQRDSSLSFDLYIPLSGNAKTLPIVYFFDPHGTEPCP